MEWITGGIIGMLIAALVIFVVGKLNLGMSVDGFVPAIIAALVIAFVSGIVSWLLVDLLKLGGGSGLWGGLVSLVVSAVVLMISDRFVPGMKVKGFVGAIVAAVAIGLMNWLVGGLLG